MKDQELPWGARIERGEIVSVTLGEGDVHLYDVESLDRPGVTGYGLQALNDALYAEGQDVYFFLFEDGTGRVIG